MIRRRGEVRGWSWVVSNRAWLLMWIPILAISVAHYGTGAPHHWVHDILRRLYYLPIVFAAFAFGLRGAMVTSAVVSVVYFPHAFTHVFHQDPSSTLEKALEIVVYNLIAAVTGSLADREVRERVKQERIAERLAESLEDVRSMERQLVRAGKLQALGELTAGLAHEIKNPLASMKGAAQIISDEIPESSPRRRMVQILTKEIDRLSAVLERFLSFARVPRFEVNDVALNDLVRPVVELMSSHARQSSVTIEPCPCAQELRVRGDKENLTLVLMNVLLNAIQASPHGGVVTIRCTAEMRRKQAYCAMIVQDQGPGVPEELRERIFDPFFTTRDGGSGLGLSIAARIVDAHGGFIEVTTGSQGGAVFRIVLPRAS